MHDDAHPPTPPPPSKKSFLVFAALKILALVFQLFRLLLWQLPSAPRLLLVQNPPSIPTLFVAWVVASQRGATLVIDWHNLGFSILAHARGGSTGHPLVRAARWYERALGHQGHKHLCVTEAMRLWLHDHFGIAAQVLHDRPPAFFGPTSLHARHDLFLRLGKQLRAWGVEERYTAATGVAIEEGETLFTVTNKKHRGGMVGGIGLREARRPALVVSSTSWTEDEDFGLLLAGLQALDAQWSAAAAAAVPFLVVVVTGKGPLKAHYEAQMRTQPLRHMVVCTMWLEAVDYPRLVGAADLGVSLHTSTSGIDLPMKVVDMFGCEVPVCALNFSCLSELVRHGDNGLVFGDAPDLAGCLDHLLGRFPADTTQLDKLRAGVAGMARWDENWTEHAAPYLLQEETAQGRRGWGLAMMVVAVVVVGSCVVVKTWS